MTNLIRRVQKHFKLKADFQPYIQSLVLKSGRREHCKIKTKKIVIYFDCTDGNVYSSFLK